MAQKEFTLPSRKQVWTDEQKRAVMNDIKSGLSWIQVCINSGRKQAIVKKMLYNHQTSFKQINESMGRAA